MYYAFYLQNNLDKIHIKMHVISKQYSKLSYIKISDSDMLTM